MTAQEQILSTVMIGTHSVEMLIAKHKSCKIFPINEYTAITQKNIERKHDFFQFSPPEFNYTLQAIKEMKEIAEENGVSGMLVTAASRLRSMENKTKLFSECRKIINIYPQLLNTKEETLLTFMGAVSGISPNLPVIVFFLGMENLDIILGKGYNIYKAFSFPIGYLTVFRKFKIKEKISLRHQLVVQNFIRKTVKKAKSDLDSWEHKHKASLIITGIPAMNYASLISKQTVYSYSALDSFPSDKKELSEVFKKFNKMGYKERSNLTWIEKDMATFLPTAVLIFQSLLSTFNLTTFILTPRGLQLGLIRYMIDEEIRLIMSKAAEKVVSDSVI